MLGRELAIDEERSLQVLFLNPRLPATDPAFQQTVEAALRQGARVLPADRVVTPYSHPGYPHLLSHDGYGVQVVVTASLPESQIEDRLEAYRNALRVPGYQVLVTGFAAANYDFGQQSKEDLTRQEGLTLPVLAVILLIVLGTVVGALLPLVLATLSIALSTALVYAVGHVVSTSTYVINVVTILGLGIAVDYALFMLSVPGRAGA